MGLKWVALLTLFCTACSGSCAPDGVTMIDGYISPSDAWRTLPENEQGMTGSTSRTVPTRGPKGPEYVQFRNGFAYSREKGPTIDSPSEILHFDARKGGLLYKTEPKGPHAVFPVVNLSGDAKAAYLRLEASEAVLVPAFFDGEPKVPAELREAAVAYREALQVVVQPSMLPYYVEMAPDWCRWVGLETP